MKSKAIQSIFGAAAILLATSSHLFAVNISIPVINSGFENPALSDGASQGGVPGWSVVGVPQSLTTWNPDTGFYPTGVPEGYNVGDIYASPAYTGFSQTPQGALGKFQTGTTYNLSLWVGANAYDTFDGYILQLLVDGIVIAQDDNSKTPPTGGFTLATLSYNYNAAQHSGLAGMPIEIRLLNKGLGGGAGGVSFDDVRFSFVSEGALAVPGYGYRVNATTPLALDGSASLATPGHTISTYAWDLDNDGLFGAADTPAEPTTAIPSTITYATLKSTWGMVDGENTIKLKVTDTNGSVSTTSTIVKLYKTANYIGPEAYRANEGWNIPANWNTGAVPVGPTDVIIPTGRTVFGWSVYTPDYTGNLYLNTNSKISFGWTTSIPQCYKMMGTPGETIIYMGSGSRLGFRMGDEPVVPEIVLNGNAEVSMGESTNGGANAQFDYSVSGSYQFTVNGNNVGKNFAHFNAVNSFASLRAINGVRVLGNVRGALGLGDIDIGGSSMLEINAEGAMNEDTTLSLSTTAAIKLQMDADDTVASLIVSGAQLTAGTYGSTSSTAANQVGWMSGTGVLTVTESPASYWDLNGATAGSGSATPTGTWGGGAEWNTNSAGTGATSSWISGGTAAFSAGADATGSYTVTVGKPSGILITKEFTTSGQIPSPGPANFVNPTIAWSLDGGNAVAVLISAINATSFTATYNGLPMTVVGTVGRRNSYSALAYIIGTDLAPLPSTGNVVINMPYVKHSSNSGGYALFGYAYSVLSLSGVASTGTAKTANPSSPPVTTTLTYSTSTNNGFVLGVSSDDDWHSNNTKTVIGQCSQVLYQGSPPAYYNTLLCYGSISSAGSYSDTYGGRPTAIVTLPLNAKAASNPSYTGQQITGMRFEDGAVNLIGNALQMQAVGNVFRVSPGASGTIGSQLTGFNGNVAGVIKRGGGTLILSSPTNNYTGNTAIYNGTLQSGASDVIPNASSIYLGGLTTGQTPVLDLNGFSETVSNIELSGTAYSNGAAITTGAGTLTLTGNISFTTFEAPQAATISGNLALDNSAHTVFVGDSGSADEDLTVTAVLSGTGNLTKTGIGTLVFSGSNSHTGLTTLNGGLTVFSGSDNSAAIGGITVKATAIARFESAGAVNGTTKNLTINSGGIIYFGSSFGAGNIPAVLANRIVGSSTGVVACDNYASTNFNFSTDTLNVYLGAINTQTYTGTITPNAGTYRVGGGPGALILPNSNALSSTYSAASIGGNVILTNSNNLSGTTTIEPGGRLQIGNGGTTGLLAASAITNNSSLVFMHSDNLDQGTHFQAPISGTGVIEQAGSGNLILDNANSHSGGTTLVSGGLILGDPNCLGTGQLTLFGGSLDAVGPGALTIGTNKPITLNASFSFGGTADLNLGSGTCYNNAPNCIITLGGSNRTLTFGGTMINPLGETQTLNVNGAGNNLVIASYLMDEALDNIPTGNLIVTGTADVAITGAIDDLSDTGLDILNLGDLTKTGTGKLTLSGNNNYTGKTYVNQGVVDLIGGTQNSDFVVNNGGILGLTIGTPITTSGSLTINTGGKIRITGTPPSSSPVVLMTASDGVFTITPELESPVSGHLTWVLYIDGNDLVFGPPPANPNAPMLVSITDDAGGSLIAVGHTVTYTVTFSKDINAATVTAVDFTNAGTSEITIGTITETAPDSGVFTVQVTPTTLGTLRLKIPTATTTDLQIRSEDDNQLDDDPALLDDTIINVTDFYTDYNAWSGGLTFDFDSNGDGYANGLAYIFGLPNVSADIDSYKPYVDHDDPDFLIITFTTSDAALTAGANPLVKYTSDLSNWNTAVASGDITIVTYDDLVGVGINVVEVSIRRTLAVGQKMFVIISADAPPPP